MCRFFSTMNNDFVNIFDVLNSDFINSEQIRSALRCSTIFSFWPEVVGQKYAKSSRPFAIKKGKIFVTCENSFVLQELFMYKKLLLKKLLSYSLPLGIDLFDIIFDYKNWTDISANVNEDGFLDFYTDEQLSNVSVKTEDFDKVFDNIDNCSYLSVDQKEKFKNRIIRLQKAKKLRLS